MHGMKRRGGLRGGVAVSSVLVCLFLLKGTFEVVLQGAAGARPGGARVERRADPDYYDVFQAPVFNKEEYREKARAMFQFGYDGYMRHAFPLDELDPIHCKGRGPDPDRTNININDVLGNYSLTLIDTLDTLALMGNKSEFVRAVRLVSDTVSFDQDVNVQVFEATIRVLGGLLSAHLIAIDPIFDMRPPDYDDELLWLARDLASRLLPAFTHPHVHVTGLPLPRVNLRHGIPHAQTYTTTDSSTLEDGTYESASGSWRRGIWRNDTCPAGAGSLVLEFGVLGHLINDPTYEAVANGIDVQTGRWLDTMSSMGAGTDSYFEYLLKAYVLFGKEDYLRLFETAFAAVSRRLKQRNFNATFVNVDMSSGHVANHWIDSLQAYLPGLQVLYGDIDGAIASHAVFAAIWLKYGALPERFNWQLKAPDFPIFPLRPELAESTYLLFRATKDVHYQKIGAQMLVDIDRYTRSKCGYATLHDVVMKTKEDRMESFFLSETCKYLFLLFDESNVLHTRAKDHVFTTEGHVFRILPEYHRVIDKRVDFDFLAQVNKSLNAHASGLLGGHPGSPSKRTCDEYPARRRLFNPVNPKLREAVDIFVGARKQKSSP